MKKLKILYSSLTLNEARAFWACVAITLFVLIPFFGSTVPSLREIPNTSGLIGRFIPLVIVVASLASAGLILHRRFNLAGTIFILGFGASLVVASMIVKGLGFIVASMVFIICSYFASMILSGRAMYIAQYSSGLMAVIILLIEIYWPFARPNITDRDFRMTVFVSAAVILLYGFFLVRQFPSFKMRSKMTIFSLALGIIPMVTIGWMAAQVGENALTADADEALSSSATQIAGSLDSFIVYNLDALRTEAKLNQVIDFLGLDSAKRKGSIAEAQLTELLYSFQQKSSLMIHSYTLMDRFGIVVADTALEDLYQDKSGGIYFSEAMRTGLPYVSPVIYPDLGSSASIYFSTPVRSSDGAIIGVLAVRYNADVLQQQLINQAASSASSSTYYILAGENNTLLAHTGNPDLMYRSFTPLSPEKFRELQNAEYIPSDRTMEEVVFAIPDISTGIAQSAAGKNTITGEFSNSNQDQGERGERGAVVRMTAAPWYVFSVQESDVLYAPINNMIRGVVMMGIIVGVLSVLLGMVLAQFMTAPVKRLAEAASKLAAGDLSARATVGHSDEIGMLSETFNTMAGQLSNMVVSLEQRVTERTKALITSTEVSRRLSTILDREALVNEVVEQLQQAFNYYHVHIYLFDDKGEYLRLAGGTGDAAQTMLSRGHKIPRGKGLVGKAAETIMPVLVPDVTQSPGWLPNPLLPATKSELAVPIAMGDDVIGVLDVQQNKVDGVQQSDADLLQSIASQVAVALQNAHSYEETHRRAEREAQMAAISQRIQRTSSAEEALQVAVRELGRALDVPQATARLSMKSGNGNGNGNGSSHGSGNGHQHA